MKRLRQLTLDLSKIQPGESFAHHGQAYRLVAVEPYTRTDGFPSVVARVAGTCRTCGEAFEAVTCRRPGWLPLTCPAHRLPFGGARGGRSPRIAQDAPGATDAPEAGRGPEAL